jgi:glutaminyl-peptide cyclotransferase
MLGDRDLKVTVPANSDETLAKIAVHAARRAGLGDGFVARVPEEVKDDHVAFAAMGWKAVDLIDFDYGSEPGLNNWWHTSADTVDKLSVESLHRSGRLVAEMLNIVL